ncbi:hypothetical protein Tco_1114521 [Tanacetum coccineum]|uniref:CCHC-type domain-containing protein n=1 Tax=Tanacetum coccineum TaxID=301880 RepID=A0ABQ5IXX9_9ASTR
MASHRSKSLYAIKECSTCGSLYTKECCSIRSFEDKILTPVPSPCCAKCGTPVDGPYCRGCAFLRKKFEEDLLTYCGENETSKDFEDISESSDDNTNVVNAPREPFVVNQDPGVKSSQDPPQIDHNCCYECGDSLDGIFCQRCICKSCGKGAHYGYNCPPKDPIISKPEPCNQTINEIPQTLPSLDPSCYSLPHVSKPNFVDNSPNFSYPPPQPQFETYSCELCGNDSHYGYDCPPQFPFVYEQEPCYNQNFSDNYYPQNSPSFSQQYLCCAYCGGPHYDYQCQPINETYYEPNPSYDYSGFDHPQPPQDSVDCQEALDKILEELEEIKRDRRKKIEDMSIEEMRHEQQLVDYKIKDITNDLGIKRFRGEEIDEEYERDCEIRIRKLKQDFNEWGSEVRKKEQAYEEEKYSAACHYMLSIPFVDEDDYIPLGDIIARYSTSKAITPDLPIEESKNSLIMGDEPLSTIPATESDEVIKSSVENLIPIPSEFEDAILREKLLKVHHLISNIESLKVNSTPDCVLNSPSSFPISVVDSDSFFEESDTSLSHLDYFFYPNSRFFAVIRRTRSGSTTTHANYSLPEYDSFLFEIEPDQEGLISIDNSNDPLLELPEFESFHFDPSFSRPPPKPPDVENLKPEFNNFDVLNNNKPFNPGEGEKIIFLNVEEDDSFTFTIHTFLPFLTYPEDYPDFDDSRAYGFVHSYIRASYPQLHLGNPIS